LQIQEVLSDCICFKDGEIKYALFSKDADLLSCCLQENEKPPLVLMNCLSYDEMKLSALLSVSSWSYFINEGTRDNKGVPQKNTQSFTTRGVIIGLIGARLKRVGLMEWQEILVTKAQNTKENGYGAFPRVGSPEGSRKEGEHDMQTSEPDPQPRRA
jgi:hypothetical protein